LEKNNEWPFNLVLDFRAKPIPIFGNGDIINYEDYNKLKEGAQVLLIQALRVEQKDKLKPESIVTNEYQ
jgi:hypothetical protein